MLFESRTRVRLTPAELNRLRRGAARNGVSLNRVETPAQLLQATLDALSPEHQSDLLRFLESDDTAPAPETRRFAGDAERR